MNETNKLFDYKDKYESIDIARTLVIKCLFKQSKKNKLLLKFEKELYNDNLNLIELKLLLVDIINNENLLNIIKHNDDVFNNLDNEKIKKHVEKCKSKIDDRNYLYKTKQDYWSNIEMIHEKLLNKEITLEDFYDDIHSVEILYNIEQPKCSKK